MQEPNYIRSSRLQTCHKHALVAKDMFAIMAVLHFSKHVSQILFQVMHLNDSEFLSSKGTDGALLWYASAKYLSNEKKSKKNLIRRTLLFTAGNFDEELHTVIQLI